MEVGVERLLAALAARMGLPVELVASEGTHIAELAEGAPFRMATTGDGLMVAACGELLAWCRTHLAQLSYGEAFEARWIARIQQAVDDAVDATLWGPDQVFYRTDRRPAIAEQPRELPEVVLLSGTEVLEVTSPGLFETGLQSVAEHSLFEIALLHGSPIAVCGGTPAADRLLSLYLEVLPEHQGRGIGTWLADHTIAILGDRGYYVYCRNALANIRSTRLIQRLGFRMMWLELVAERVHTST